VGHNGKISGELRISLRIKF